jgi:hypothetical protein
MGRVGDTGTETKPHSLELGQGSTVSGRLVLVVGLLVMLVGGGSAVGTMLVLSARGGEPAAAADGGAAREGVEGGAEVEDRASVGDVGARVIERTEEGEDEIVLDGDEPAELEAARADEGDAPTDGPSVAGTHDPGEEDEEPEPASPVAVAEPAQPKGPEHETERCAKVRADAVAAEGSQQWETAIQLLAQQDCWPPRGQVSRRRKQVAALAETGRYSGCIKAGRRAKDPETVEYVAYCRSKIE